MTASVADFPVYPSPRPRVPMCPFDLAPELEEIRSKGTVTRVKIWNGMPAWLITGGREQRAVLADPRFSADDSRAGYPIQSAAFNARRRSLRTFVTMDDPEHARLRRMITGWFTIRQTEAMRPKIQQIVDSLIDDMLKTDPPVDLVQAFAKPVPALVTCEMLGLPYSDHAFVHKTIETYTSRETSAEDAMVAVNEMGDYLREAVRVKLAKPGDDLLSRLVTDRVGTGQLSEDEATALSSLLLEGGFDTTANMISLGTLALLDHPDQLAEIRGTDDPKVIANAVEELLRYLNIAHNGRRRVALEDVTIAGQLIREGEAVICSNEAANRDPIEFPYPDQLDIHRNASRHLGFSYGIHQCIGQSLARVELEVVYGTLYRRIPKLRVAVDRTELKFFDGIVYSMVEFPVEW